MYRIIILLKSEAWFFLEIINRLFSRDLCFYCIETDGDTIPPALSLLLSLKRASVEIYKIRLCVFNS